MKTQPKEESHIKGSREGSPEPVYEIEVAVCIKV